jgi:hypothetical protein
LGEIAWWQSTGTIGLIASLPYYRRTPHQSCGNRLRDATPFLIDVARVRI